MFFVCLFTQKMQVFLKWPCLLRSPVLPFPCDKKAYSGDTGVSLLNRAMRLELPLRNTAIGIEIN